MELKDKNILVVGLAKTGVSCCRFLASKGACVTATDMCDEAALSSQIGELKPFNINWKLGFHDEADFVEADLIVVSPGVPQEHPMLVAAKLAGREIVSEIELACRFINAPLAAITGTNGKTTTTTILGEIFKNSGYSTFVGGNIGNPLIELVESGESAERVVAEISSFQLEWVNEFRPAVAALLNLSEDHLDRYATYQDYINAKLLIFQKQTKADFAVVNRDDQLVWQYAQTLKGKIFPFSRKEELQEGIFLKDAEIVYRHDGSEERFPTAKIKLQGVHNLENIMAAVASALLLGCRPDKAFETIQSFESLHHRMEFVAKVNGVSYFEDSKATNVGSVAKALESFNNITLIAGGKDKGGSYAPLLELVQERVLHLVLIGEAAKRMASEFEGITDIRYAKTLEDAVRISAEITQPGGVVLMSPACSSFDMFRNYEERAERYISAVKEL